MSCMPSPFAFIFFVIIGVIAYPFVWPYKKIRKFIASRKNQKRAAGV